jgi:hypothetical protein
LNAGPRQSSDNYQKRVEEYKEREEENYYAIDWQGYNTHPEGRKGRKIKTTAPKTPNKKLTHPMRKTTIPLDMHKEKKNTRKIPRKENHR